MVLVLTGPPRPRRSGHRLVPEHHISPRDPKADLDCAVHRVVDLPDLKPEDWAYLVVRMRTSEKLRYLAVAFDHPTNQPGLDYPSFLTWGRLIRPVDDATSTATR